MNSPEDSAAQSHNRQAWNGMVRANDRLTRPARDADFVNPLAVVDGLGWLGGDIRNRRLLCLAAGGGRQGPLYAAAGAEVTVVDISPAMLELDRQVAAERRLSLKTVETSMDDLSMFADAEFDIIIHPVSTCYLADLTRVYAEAARVASDNAIYISQHKQPTSLQAEIEPSSPLGYTLIEPYYREGPLPEPAKPSRLREQGALEYLHRWEQLLGLMCRAGFAIEDLVEPMHADHSAELGSFGHRASYIAPYVRIKARRQGRQGRGAPAGIWTP